jgi:hypothetical protein
MEEYATTTTAATMISNIIHQASRSLQIADNITNAFTVENQVEFTTVRMV